LDDNRKPPSLDELIAENAALRAQVVELELLADTDTLTPLANRRAFLRRLEQAILQVERHAIPIALIFVDLNSMKAVNDAHGHSAGDAVLLHVARHLKSSLRATDMVARIGGDEFGLILDYAREPDVMVRMEKLAATLMAEPVEHNGHSFPVGLAWGVTMIEGNDSPDAALARADAAMYAAKGAQRSDR
jgi:diguanylate cyclase (GGDEF)-like protein